MALRGGDWDEDMDSRFWENVPLMTSLRRRLAGRNAESDGEHLQIDDGTAVRSLKNGSID